MVDNQHLLIKVAQLYYEKELTQEDIARRLRLSRPKVSRLLQEAREAGIVKITVARSPGSHIDLERQLEQRYGLNDALVVEASQPEIYETTARELGASAAGYLRQVIQDGDTIGLTWGLTLSSMVENLLPDKKRNVTVIQLVGGLGEPDAETHATHLARWMAEMLNASLKLIPAPGIVKTIELARLLRDEPFVSQVLRQISQVNLAIVGIGAFTKDSLLMRDGRILTWDEVQPLLDQGAVGDIGLHIYDIHGNVLPSPIEQRLIGASVADYRSISRVIGIAGGRGKYPAILGSVRGRLVNSLITDLETAERLLAETG